jgi:uracil-DNA glycosylase
VESLDTLHTRILACRICQDAGYIERAAPVVSGHAGNRIMLIGQAPGQTELTKRRPFAGPAGRVLFGWMRSIGIEEEIFRDRVYMTAITKCFPGKARSGNGDRRPSAREIEFCHSYLEAQISLVRPEAVLLVGGLAIERYFPRTPLADLIGQSFERDGVRFIPLPHPSGASRWLNDPENRQLLQEALALVREEWDRLAAPVIPTLLEA